MKQDGGQKARDVRLEVGKLKSCAPAADWLVEHRKASDHLRYRFWAQRDLSVL